MKVEILHTQTETKVVRSRLCKYHLVSWKQDLGLEYSKSSKLDSNSDVAIDLYSAVNAAIEFILFLFLMPITLYVWLVCHFTLFIHIMLC